jgi:hypothetical protein
MAARLYEAVANMDRLPSSGCLLFQIYLFKRFLFILLWIAASSDARRNEPAVIGAYAFVVFALVSLGLGAKTPLRGTRTGVSRGGFPIALFGNTAAVERGSRLQLWISILIPRCMCLPACMASGTAL